MGHELHPCSGWMEETATLIANEVLSLPQAPQFPALVPASPPPSAFCCVGLCTGYPLLCLRYCSCSHSLHLRTACLGTPSPPSPPGPPCLYCWVTLGSLAQLGTPRPAPRAYRLGVCLALLHLPILACCTCPFLQGGRAEWQVSITGGAWQGAPLTPPHCPSPCRDTQHGRCRGDWGHHRGHHRSHHCHRRGCHWHSHLPAAAEGAEAAGGRGGRGVSDGARAEVLGNSCVISSDWLTRGRRVNFSPAAHQSPGSYQL